MSSPTKREILDQKFIPVSVCVLSVITSVLPQEHICLQVSPCNNNNNNKEDFWNPPSTTQGGSAGHFALTTFETVQPARSLTAHWCMSVLQLEHVCLHWCMSALPLERVCFQVSLNEGCHQLRLFSQGPNGVDPFTESCLRDANVRIIPCASMLVRLYKVPRGPKGKPLEVRKGHNSQDIAGTSFPCCVWSLLGLVVREFLPKRARVLFWGKKEKRRMTASILFIIFFFFKWCIFFFIDESATLWPKMSFQMKDFIACVGRYSAICSCCWSLSYSAILHFWADSLCSCRVWFKMSDCCFSQHVFEYPPKWCTYSAVWLLHGWCQVKQLLSRCIPYNHEQCHDITTLITIFQSS